MQNQYQKTSRPQEFKAVVVSNLFSQDIEAIYKQRNYTNAISPCPSRFITERLKYEFPLPQWFATFGAAKIGFQHLWRRAAMKLDESRAWSRFDWGEKKKEEKGLRMQVLVRFKLLIRHQRYFLEV